MKDFTEVMEENRMSGSKWLTKRMVMKDGFSVSVQASEYSYCSPRIDTDYREYNAFELGFPSDADELINQYAEDHDDLTETVYGYVPIEVVQSLIDKHGGVDELATKATGERTGGGENE